MSDSLVARGGRTLDGATLFAKNSDRRGREPQSFVQFPSAFHARGSRLRCTHIEIDQVAESYRVMGHSPQGCWGFEQGVNEYGVAIGNQGVCSREPLEPDPGLIGTDLVRLGLERGRNAREALEVIASLLEAHGQGGAVYPGEGDEGSQNSFLIADGGTSWVFETTARGWAARETEAVGMTNELSLGTNWQIGSRELERQAAQAGLWTRRSRLNFRAAYLPEQSPTQRTRRRREASEHRLSRPALTLSEFVHWLRDHGEADLPGPLSIQSKGAVSEGPTICMHDDPVSTTASLAVRLPGERSARPWPVYISFASPCSGIFVPVYLDGVIPEALASARLWEAMRRLQERVATDGARHLPWVREEWRNHERSIEAERERVEDDAAQCFAEEDQDGGGQILTRFMASVAERVQAKALEMSLALEPRRVRD